MKLSPQRMLKLSEMESGPEHEGSPMKPRMIVLLVILVLITAGSMFWSNELGKANACRANLEVLAASAERFMVKEGQPPQAIGDLTPTYVKNLPSCEVQPEVSYELVVTQERLEFICKGHAHWKAGIPENQPQASASIRKPKPVTSE